MTLLSATVLLFFVMDPLGNTPLFLTAMREVPQERKRHVLFRELVIALVILVAFLFGGKFLLEFLQVSPAALNASGGLVLLLIAIRMIFPAPDASMREELDKEPFIFPLAVPYTAGPSAMATVLLLMSREPHRWATWLAAVCIAWLASAVILFFGSKLERLLGDRGLLAMERLMGMLLAMVAMEMMLDGAAEYLGVASP